MLSVVEYGNAKFSFGSMNLTITWKRTVIGGDTLHHDFVAEADGQDIGRIMRFQYGQQKGQWSWNFHLGHSDFRYRDVAGQVLTRREAVAKIVAAYQDYLTYPADKGGGAS